MTAIAPRPAAVLFDRDGTLVLDVPYNGDPDRVEPVPGAASALARLRAAGVPTAVVSNQSGIARGLLTEAQVRAVNARVEELLGPLGPWAWCPHGPDDGCDCRKPAPGLILRAAARLGVDPARCVVIGDIGADVRGGARRRRARDPRADGGDAPGGDRGRRRGRARSRRGGRPRAGGGQTRPTTTPLPAVHA